MSNSYHYPLRRYLIEKRAALPPQEQTQAIVAQGEKKKKGLSTGAKLLGLGGALALGLGTGKVQAAGKALKGVMKNPTTGKFDPVGAVKRGYRDMGNRPGSMKAVETQHGAMEEALFGGGKIKRYRAGEEGANFARKGGWASKGVETVGTAGKSAQRNILAGVKKEMPELFDDAGKLLPMDKMSPEQAKKGYDLMRQIAAKQELQAVTGGQKVMNTLGRYLPGEKAVIGGLTGMSVAGELGTAQDASGRKRSLGERMIRAGTVGAAGVALNPLFMGGKVGLIPGMLAFEAGNRTAGAAGGLAGRGVTKATGGEYGSPVEEIKSHTPFMGGH